MKTFLRVGSLATFLIFTMSSFAPAPPATNGKYSYSYSPGLWYNACAGEYIQLTGEVTIKGNWVTVNGVTSYTYRYNYGGIKGVGMTSGNKYVMNGTIVTKYKYATCDYTYKYNHYKLKLIGQGKAPDVTFNATYTYDWDCTDYTYEYEYWQDCH